MKSTIYFDAHRHAPDNRNIVGVQNVIVHRKGCALDWQKKQLYSVGVHPWCISEEDVEIVFRKLETFLKQPNVVAIGECGLDKVVDTDWNLQLDVFQRQIDLSEKLQKPMIIHAVRSHSEILEMRKKKKVKQVWIIHGYNKSKEMAEQFVNSTCMLSFGHHICRMSEASLGLFQNLSLDSFFIESDEDYLSLEVTYNKIAKFKNIDLESLILAQEKNFNRIFKIDN